MNIADERCPPSGLLISKEQAKPLKQQQQAGGALASGKRLPIVLDSDSTDSNDSDDSDKPAKKKLTCSNPSAHDKNGFIRNPATHWCFEPVSPPTLRHETAWKKLTLDKLGSESPKWNPVKYPLPGPVILHPPERVLSFDIKPRPSKQFEQDLRDRINQDIRDGLPGYSAWAKFRPLSLTKNNWNDKVTSRAMVSVVKANKRSGSPLLANISFETLEEAAFFKLEEGFSLYSGGEQYNLTLRRAGRCHPQDLTAIGITPELPDGTNADTVGEEDYIDTAVGLLKKCPELEPIGAWREMIKWNDDKKQMCPRVVLVVRKASDFDESRIPGYGNNHGIYENICTAVPQHATWFRFEFGKRRPYCKHCKTELHGLSFWNLIIVWLKLLIPWRFFRLWALADGVDAPENMIRCMANNYSALGFWRSWHRSYNLWIVRYIYIPLGGSSNAIVSIVLVFTFVALWHDLSLKLLTWGWLVSLFILPEIIAAKVVSKDRYGSEWWYRHVCACGGVINILMMMTANLVGFVIGTDGISYLWKQILGSWTGLQFVMTACGILFVGVQVMFEYREEESRRGTFRKC